METLNITVNEYINDVVDGVDKAISPLKAIRDLTKLMAKDNVPLQIEDSYSFYQTLDTCIKQIQDIIFIV